jgi:phage regulator Rha-like protein
MPEHPLPLAASSLPVPVELIERRIYVIRGQKVMLDSDLAELYQVETFNLNKAVKRNCDRFPEDFMFQLSSEEAKLLTFQFGMSKPEGRGGRRTLPYAFTEHGVAMLSSVLNSRRAVQMNILIIRAFVKLRELLATHKELARKIDQIEAAQKQQARTQQQHTSILVSVVEDIQKLKNPPFTRAIGFLARSSKKK